MYFAFPSGRPGLGLVLLRMAASGAILAAAVRVPLAMQPWALWAALALSTLLLAGWLTRFSALIALSAGLAAAALGSDDLRLLAALEAAVTGSLLLLGPGAYAADALLSGRRVIAP